MIQNEQTATSGANGKTGPTDKEEASPEKLSITMDKRADLALAVFVVLLGVFILFKTRDIMPGSLSDPLTSRGLGYATGAFLTLVGMILSAVRLWTWSAIPGKFLPAEGQPDDEGHPASSVRAFGIIAAMLLWVALLKPLGFLIVTPLCLLAILLLMGMRSRVTIIAFSTIFTLSTWFIFGPLLDVRIPMGPLTRVFRLWGLTP